MIINEKRIQFIKKINSEYFFVFKDEYNIDIYDINGNYILGKFRFDSNHIIEISKNKFISSKEGMSSEGSIYVLNFICKPEQKPIFNQEQKIFYDDSYVIKIEWVDDQKILLVLTNKQLYFYFINNINNFDYTHIKEINLKKI